MQNYKYAALCYLSIFNNVLLYNFCFFKYEVACIALNVIFKYIFKCIIFFLCTVSAFVLLFMYVFYLCYMSLHS
jgi:hypothetical protein